MDGADSLVGILAVNDAGDFDLAGGDHLDIDVVVGQGLEHLGSHAAVALHASAHDGDLGAGGVHTDIGEVCAVLQGTQSGIGLALCTGEGYPSCRRGRWTAG